MRIGYLECFAGISGDMLLGALMDVGVSQSLLEETARALNIGASLRFSSVDRSGIAATKVDVLDAASGEIAEHRPSHDHHHSHHDHSHSHDHDPHHEDKHVHGRSWKQIRELIENAQLALDARALALRAFELLAQAEAKIHSVPVETVHFHEVGAVDTITDIVCAAVGLCSLGLDMWYASAVNVGSGFVQCAHGLFPVPAPATAELLKGIPTYSAGIQKELTTPTGAAILKALGCSFVDVPVITTEAIGYGAGTRNPKDFPNVLRLSIGDSTGARKTSGERVSVLECAVDDATPQLLAHTMERVLEEGALDVMCAPVVMKKGRMGSLLTVLCRPDRREALEELLLRETTTLGLRVREEDRVILTRRFVEVETAYGAIRVKIGSRNGEDLNWMPEYEDCARAAREHGVPLKQVMQSVLSAADKKVEA
ncbi:nickel pincer cofactor biosynthesis protein LarC [Alloacidobacterium dinghuense]|uniref:Putative nickel insertion protein n=1 Tax=Alloacidobacterium dinghuense TaxID=2763107 RepID=A0A7G8BCN2_9BACT|nr:nickel pincer cofactor biosynthesis protein LarC [Alloacidobacterium dinghuense]QNI30302.1 nickel pincer cofactor biosynthesis protein LarC [Alloacidobacterium dinghuense]